MPLSSVWQFLRDFAVAFLQEGRGALGYPKPLEIVEDSPGRFVATGSLGMIVADKHENTVRLGGRLVAPIAAVTSVEIRQWQSGDGPDVWHIWLCLLRGRRVEVARLLDDTEASILAARLGTLTGRPVVARR